MPFGSFYNNGRSRWAGKTILVSPLQTVTTPTNIINVNIGCNIKSDIVGLTFKIVNISNTIIAHFIINGIVSWNLQNTQIIIYSMDNVTYYLNFNTATEAAIGDLRLYRIMEGDSIINCGDEGALPLSTEGGTWLTTEDGTPLIP